MKARIANTNTNTNTNRVSSLNRKQRRKIAKRFGMTMQQVSDFFGANVVIDTLPDDTVVTLNYDNIMSRKEDKSQLYLEFVEKMKDKELHVFQDDTHKNSDLYCLREDENKEAPYLFHLNELDVVEIEGGITIGDDDEDVDENTIENISEDTSDSD